MKIINLYFSGSLLTVIALLVMLFNYTMPQSVEYPTHIHKILYLDRQFEPDEVLLITQAALEWNKKTHHIVEMDIVTLPSSTPINIDIGIIVSKVSPDYPEILLQDHASGNLTLGLYYREHSIDRIQLVTDRLSADMYVGVILHELGHALGLEHRDGYQYAGTLMYPSSDLSASEITNRDLEYFCELYHCDAHTL